MLNAPLGWFMKSVNWPKPDYTCITCSTISNIPYNLIFTTKFNGSSILITIISHYHSKKSLNSFIRIDRNYLFGSFEITSIRLYTPLRNPLRGLHGACNLIEVISSWIEQKLRSILNGIVCPSLNYRFLVFWFVYYYLLLFVWFDTIHVWLI
jgi:hypothetical protein